MATEFLQLKKVRPIISELDLGISSQMAFGSNWTLSISTKIVCV